MPGKMEQQRQDNIAAEEAEKAKLEAAQLAADEANAAALLRLENTLDNCNTHVFTDETTTRELAAADGADKCGNIYDADGPCAFDKIKRKVSQGIFDLKCKKS